MIYNLTQQTTARIK